MRFRIEQRLAAPVERVEATLLDPAWYQAVAASNAAWEPQLLGIDEGGGTVVELRVRYRFRGTLNPAAAKVVSPDKLSMVHVSTHDRAGHRGDLRIEPDHYADRLRFSGGSVVLRPEGQVTVRIVEGDLRVKMPLVAGKVERAIVSGLQDHAAVEEREFAAFVASGR